MNENNLPGYRFIRDLCHDSQRKVYLAERSSDFVKVVIRKLDMIPIERNHGVDSFHRDIETYQSFEGSGVAKLYEVIEQPQENPPSVYLVHEYIEGHSLAEMLEDKYLFSFGNVMDIALQMLTILKQLHNHQPPLFHGNIKPSSMILKPQNNDEFVVYLVDFASISYADMNSGMGATYGTYGYIPPEQLMGKTEPASDIYSLAAVIVQLLSGHEPCDIPVVDFRLKFESYLQEMDPKLVSVLQQMLEPLPVKRLSDINILNQLFDEILHSYMKNDYTPQNDINYTGYGNAFGAPDSSMERSDDISNHWMLTDEGQYEMDRQTFKNKLAGFIFLIFIILTIIILLVKNLFL